MTDPILNEPAIMDTLNCRCVADNASRLQAAAAVSLIDAYDRKLKREEFIALAGAALEMHTQIGKLFMIVSVTENHALGVLSEVLLARTVAGVTDMSEKAHGELIRLMERVVMCPTSTTPVH